VISRSKRRVEDRRLSSSASSFSRGATTGREAAGAGLVDLCEEAEAVSFSTLSGSLSSNSAQASIQIFGGSPTELPPRRIA
jgi:hypothetical protein